MNEVKSSNAFDECFSFFFLSFYCWRLLLLVSTYLPSITTMTMMEYVSVTLSASSALTNHRGEKTKERFGGCSFPPRPHIDNATAWIHGYRPLYD
jgi:hypothetical protein